MKHLFQISFIFSIVGGRPERLLGKDNLLWNGVPYLSTVYQTNPNFFKKRNLNILNNMLACETMETIFSFMGINLNFYEFIAFTFNIKNITFSKIFISFSYDLTPLTGFELVLFQQNNFINSKLNSRPFMYFSVLESTSDTMLAEFATKHPELVINNNGWLELDQEKFNAYQERLLLEVDKEFWTKLVTWRPLLGSDPEDLYEFKQDAPFKINSNYTRLADFQASTDEWYELLSWYISYEFKWTYYYEPFFFFNEKIEQPLDEFWLVCFFRQRALLLEERLFDHSLKWNDPKADVPLFSHLKSKSELRSALKIYKWFLSYRNNHLSAYYLKFDDIQTLTFDNRFVHVWNYWLGAYHELNEFAQYGWLGFINFLWEKIYTPLTHVNSKLYREEYGYNSTSTRVLQFVFFPDAVLMTDDFNVSFDTFTDNFARFFHFGKNYMDAILALDYVRYQITENLWGEFESLVEDYAAYQPTYESDNFGAMWLPIILLLSKEYESPRSMDIFLNNYNDVFQFWRIKEFKILWAKNFFALKPLERLASFRDVQTIDSQMLSMDWLVNMFFGYNLSDCISNHPKWLLDFFSPNIFYSLFNYDTSEDLAFEENFVWIMSSLTKYNYTYRTTLPIYFQKVWKTFNLDYLFSYFNEKIYDDYGYILSSFSRIDMASKPEVFSWLDKNSLFYAECLPNNHYSWRIVIFNNFFFEWTFKDNFEILSFMSILRKNFFNLLELSFFDPNSATLPQFQSKILVLKFHLEFLLEYPLGWVITFTEVYFGSYFDLVKLMYNFLFSGAGVKLNFLLQYILTWLDTIKVIVVENFELYYLSALEKGNLLDSYFMVKFAKQFYKFLFYYTIPNCTFYSDFIDLSNNEKGLVDVNRYTTFIRREERLLFQDFFFPPQIYKYFAKYSQETLAYITELLLYHHITYILVERLDFKYEFYETFFTARSEVFYICLPKSFFIPYFFDLNLAPKVIFFSIKNLSKIIFYPFLPNGTPVDPRNINQLTDFILYAGVLDINNKRNVDYFLQANVHILNKMDWKDINYDSLEYKRYLNYVLKHKCYKKN